MSDNKIVLCFVQCKAMLYKCTKYRTIYFYSCLHTSPLPSNPIYHKLSHREYFMCYFEAAYFQKFILNKMRCVTITIPGDPGGGACEVCG